MLHLSQELTIEICHFQCPDPYDISSVKPECLETAFNTHHSKALGTRKYMTSEKNICLRKSEVLVSDKEF